MIRSFCLICAAFRSAAAALCFARKPLNGQDERSIAAISYLLVLAVICAVAELAWWVVNPVVGAGALIQLSHGDLLMRTVIIGAVVAALVLRYFYVQFHWKHLIASEASKPCRREIARTFFSIA